ncbi:ankyrin repeat-containing domain protein [Whalleya microplaca]|nr:ankyrin repeat-containing domain protein [Whalleya microplaca]
MFACLLRNGADVNFDMGDGCTALHVACFHSYSHEDSGAYRLINLGADVNAEFTGEGISGPFTIRPLDMCCALQDSRTNYPVGDWNYKPQKSKVKLAKRMIEKGADVHPHGTSGSSPLVIASRFHFIDMMDLLHRYGANVCQPDHTGNFPLRAAILRESGLFAGESTDRMESCVSWLLKRGANVHQRDADGHTVLYTLLCQKAFDEKAPVLKRLLDAGAKKISRIRLPCGRDVLRGSFYQREVNVCRTLLAYKGRLPSYWRNLSLLLPRLYCDMFDRVVDYYVKGSHPEYPVDFTCWKRFLDPLFLFLTEIDDRSGTLLKVHRYYWPVISLRYYDWVVRAFWDAGACLYHNTCIPHAVKVEFNPAMLVASFYGTVELGSSVSSSHLNAMHSLITSKRVTRAFLAFAQTNLLKLTKKIGIHVDTRDGLINTVLLLATYTNNAPAQYGRACGQPLDATTLYALMFIARAMQIRLAPQDTKLLTA